MTISTIIAMATPPGRGGVAILRLSGPKAYNIALQLNGRKPLTPRLARFTSFYKTKPVSSDLSIDSNDLVQDLDIEMDCQLTLIDQGVMIYFKGPHSFTGEDIVEIQAHGSPLVLDILTKECLHLGAQLAKPGEFSERAFLNGKIDLTQAEAIADLIQASSETAATMAMRSLQGEFSKIIHEISQEIIHLRIYVEAAIDFPEEEIDFLNDGKIALMLTSIMAALDKLHAQAHQGMIIREGLSLVIVGRPNAGKSTLLNRLAGNEVAIVTDIPGTTRDLLKSHILLDDIPLHIIDTAGLRESTDKVELEGIKRTWQELEKADCILMLVDIADEQEEHSLFVELQQRSLGNKPIIIVINKLDRLSINEQAIKLGSFKLSGLSRAALSESKSSKKTSSTLSTIESSYERIFISAKEGLGLDKLKTTIKQAIGYKPTEGHFLARRRHLDALTRARELILTGQDQLMQHKAGELLAEDLRLAHHALGSIVGEVTSDDLLGKIFSSFCIGK